MQGSADTALRGREIGAQPNRPRRRLRCPSRGWASSAWAASVAPRWTAHGLLRGRVQGPRIVVAPHRCGVGRAGRRGAASV